MTSMLRRPCAISRISVGSTWFSLAQMRHWRATERVESTSTPSRSNSTAAQCNRNMTLSSKHKEAHEKRAAIAAALPNSLLRSEHLHGFHLNRVPRGVASDGDMVPDMVFQSIRILHRQDLLVRIGHHYHLGTLPDALLGTIFLAGSGALHSTVGVSNPTVYRIACRVRCG